MRDTLRATRVRGTVCFSGMLSGVWTVPEWYPMDYIPNGVRLTAYSGEAADLPPDVLQSFLDDLATGRLVLPVHRPYAFDEIVEAHTAMEENAATGKLVVVV
jgi:NADPH:quinone reductase-like Zn-dependent oxidoreductase